MDTHCYKCNAVCSMYKEWRVDELGSVLFYSEENIVCRSILDYSMKTPRFSLLLSVVVVFIYYYCYCHYFCLSLLCHSTVVARHPA